MSANLAGELMTARRFLPMWAAQNLGAFNDNLFRYALVTLAGFSGMTVLGLDSDLMVALAASAFTLPIFLFAAIAGRLADQFDRTKLMRIAKFAEIWIMALAAIGFIAGEPLLLLVTLFFMGMQSAFFSPPRFAAIPTLLKPEELVTANALLSGALNISVLIGLILGTLMIGMDGGPTAISLILVGLAIIGWIVMRQLPSAPPPDNPQAQAWLRNHLNAWRYPSFMPDSNHLLRLVWNLFCSPILLVLTPVRIIVWELVRALYGLAVRPRILRPVLGTAWFWMLAATLITLLARFVPQTLGGTEEVYSMLAVLFTVFGALGAAACATLNRGGTGMLFSAIGATGLAIFPALVAWLTRDYVPGEEVGAAQFLADERNWPILAALAGAAFSSGLFVAPMQALAQRRTPPAERGRLLSGSAVLNGLAATLGQGVLAGLSFFGLPLQIAFYVIAAVSAGIALSLILGRGGESAG
jgi:acyl-[acyl-carrier-protein]-phospholipid O-acyltransferase/long-chain-fatty-acid--[acyl-carrier-protein] ligase